MGSNVRFRSGRVIVAAGLAATALAVPAAASAEPTPCQVSTLPLPSGLWSGTVDAVDPSGRWQAGTAQDTDGVQHLVRWEDGVPRDLGTTYPGVAGINRSGDMVGGTTTGDVSHVWRYHDGRFVPLPPLRAGDVLTVGGINDAGTVTGTSIDPWGVPETPVVWSPDGTVSALPVPAGDNVGQPVGIDADGTVLGTVGYDPHDTVTPWHPHPAVWHPDGSLTELPGPADGLDTDIAPVAIEHGVITGNRPTATDSWSVWQWATSSAAPTVVTDGQAVAANTTGALALRAADRSSAALWRDGTRRTLPIPAEDPGMQPWQLAGVTDADTVYGAAYHVNTAEDVTPLRWTCTLAG
jgi:hypothetical protein